MGFVSWVVPIQRADGTTGQLPVVGHGTALIIYDAGDVPIGLPIDDDGAGHLTLVIYDKDENKILIPCFPAVIGTDVQASLAENLIAGRKVTPSTIKSAADTLKPTTFGGLKITAVAATSSPATCLAPTIVKGALLKPMPIAAASAGAIATPPTASLTLGMTPATQTAPSAAIAPLIRKGVITRAPALQSSTAVPFAHALAGTRSVKPALQAAIAKPLVPALVFPIGVSPATLNAPSSALAPLRVMGTAKRLVPVVNATSALLTPAAVATGGPPAFPQVTPAPATTLLPKLVGSGSRAASLVAATSSALAPVRAMGARVPTPAKATSTAAALTPTIVRARNAGVARLSVTAACIAPTIKLGKPAPLQSSSATCLAPTIVKLHVHVMAIASTSATSVLPNVHSPLELLHPDVAIAIASTLQHAIAHAAKLVQPDTLSSAAVTRRATRVQDLQPADVVLEADVTTHVDFTQEHDLVQTVQQSTTGIIFDIPLRDSAGNALDLESASLVYVWLRPPGGGAAKRLAAAVLGEPSLGVVRYVTGPADFHEHGVWGVQVGLQLSNGAPAWSSVELVRALPNVGPYGPQSSSPQAVSVAGVLEPSLHFS